MSGQTYYYLTGIVLGIRPTKPMTLDIAADVSDLKARVRQRLTAHSARRWSCLGHFHQQR
jgi:hypothetical protein